MSELFRLISLELGRYSRNIVRICPSFVLIGAFVLTSGLRAMTCGPSLRLGSVRVLSVKQSRLALESDGVREKTLVVSVEDRGSFSTSVTRVEFNDALRNPGSDISRHIDSKLQHVGLGAITDPKRVESLKLQNEIQNQMKENSNFYRGQIEEAVDFAVSQMEDRRATWRGDFTTKLRKLAYDYMDNAIYITVRDKKTNKIVGTLRLIKKVYFDYSELVRGIDAGKVEKFWRPRFLNSEECCIYPIHSDEIDPWVLSETNRYFSNLPEGRPVEHTRPPDLLFNSPQKFPMEVYLGRSAVHASVLADPTSKLGQYGVRIGQTFEVGNFAIDKELPLQVRSEIFLELSSKAWGYIYEQSENFPARYQPGGLGIVTYADPASFEMYRKLGLKPVGPALEKDGIEWRPMAATGEELDSVKKRIEEIKAKN